MKRLTASALLILAIAVPACGRPSDEAGDGKADPVTLIRNKQTHITELSLTPAAARRLDIRRARVERDGSNTVVPYAAILYTPDGKTWVFASRGRLRFARVGVVVQDIHGDNAVLSSGPPVGSTVVSRGAAELFGAESGVGEQ